MRQLNTALRLLGLCMLLLGLLYPLAVTGLSQLLFSHRANGSLILRFGRPVGSELLGQSFASARYFHSRPSASGYDAVRSGSSNLSPANPVLVQRVRARLDSVRRANRLGPDAVIPSDLVLESGSGLDPDVSPQAALLQVTRVARSRGLDASRVRELVRQNTVRPGLGVFSSPSVDVLKLNLALDSIEEILSLGSDTMRTGSGIPAAGGRDHEQ